MQAALRNWERLPNDSQQRNKNLALQPQGTEFYQQSDWTWKYFFFRVSRREHSPTDTLVMGPWENLSREPDEPCS